MTIAFPLAFCWIVSTIPQALVAGGIVDAMYGLFPEIKL